MALTATALVGWLLTGMVFIPLLAAAVVGSLALLISAVFRPPSCMASTGCGIASRERTRVFVAWGLGGPSGLGRGGSGGNREVLPACLRIRPGLFAYA